jgi:ankyrin repeat protein
LQVVLLLLQHQEISANMVTKDGLSALHYLVRLESTGSSNNDLILSLSTLHKVWSLLIAKGANLNIPGTNQSTPLHDAAMRGCEHATRWLLANGVEVNAQNKSGETPLHLAVRAKRYTIIWLLLDAGANKFICDKSTEEGVAPITLARSLDDYTYVLVCGISLETLKDKPTIQPAQKNATTLMHIAVENNRIDFVHDVVRNGPVDLLLARDKEGLTCLHWAAKCQHLDIVEQLLNSKVKHTCIPQLFGA